jgi:hypothetical protein
MKPLLSLSQTRAAIAHLISPCIRGLHSPAGAPYHLPSLFSEHTQGPIYRQEFESPKAIGLDGTQTSLPHPSKDRTSWMIGQVAPKSDMAYYSNIAGNMGPAF